MVTSHQAFHTYTNRRIFSFHNNPAYSSFSDSIVHFFSSTTIETILLTQVLTSFKVGLYCGRAVFLNECFFLRNDILIPFAVIAKKNKCLTLQIFGAREVINGCNLRSARDTYNGKKKTFVCLLTKEIAF